MLKFKTILGICFILVLGLLGLFAGTLVGKLFVPSDSGLAGPAIALGYGVGGAIMGLILGVNLVRRLNYNQLRTALLGATIIVLLACAWIVYRVRIVQQEPPNSKSEATSLHQSHRDVMDEDESRELISYFLPLHLFSALF